MRTRTEKRQRAYIFCKKNTKNLQVVEASLMSADDRLRRRPRSVQAPWLPAMLLPLPPDACSGPYPRPPHNHHPADSASRHPGVPLRS